MIARARPEGRRVVEKDRDISQVMDRRVIFERVGVVEVEAVVEMIRVSSDERD